MARLLREAISQVFQEEIHDPVIKDVNVLTVTEVKVSSDLKYARVYVSLYGKPEKTLAAFNRIKKATSFIRFKISEWLREMKFIPEIRFYLDRTPAEAARIMEIFHQLEKEKGRVRVNENSRKNKKAPKKR